MLAKMSPKQTASDCYITMDNSQRQNQFSRQKSGPCTQEAVCGHSSTSQNRSTELFECNQPCSPHMGNFRARINTFLSNWPNHINATPKQIAEAGFFFLGDRDRVKCFYCNGGLQNWTRNDEPWFEHAKWYPDCEFVLKSKGIEYVRSIASQFPDIKRPFAVAKQPPKTQNYVTPATSLAAATSSTAATALRYKSPAFDVTREMQGQNNGAKTTNKNLLLSEAMNNLVVKEACNFGFDFDHVKAVVEAKIDQDNVEYTSVMELVSDIQKYESQIKEDEPMEEDIYGAPQHNLHHSNFFAPPTITGLVSQSGSKKLIPSKLGQQNPSVTSSQPVENPADLTREIDNIKQEQLCKICLDNDSDCVLMNCGHVCCCSTCGSAIRSCPICRAKLDKIVKFYRR